MNWIFETYSDIYQTATKPRIWSGAARLEPTDRPRTARWSSGKR
jgi:hypothetical protein